MTFSANYIFRVLRASTAEWIDCSTILAITSKPSVNDLRLRSKFVGDIMYLLSYSFLLTRFAKPKMLRNTSETNCNTHGSIAKITYFEPNLPVQKTLQHKMVIRLELELHPKIL